MQQCFSIFQKSKHWKCILQVEIRLRFWQQVLKRVKVIKRFVWQSFRVEPECEQISDFTAEQHHRRNKSVNRLSLSFLPSDPFKILKENHAERMIDSLLYLVVSQTQGGTPYKIDQPCSQGLSSYRSLERARRDPGTRWSRVSQNLEDDS